MILTRRAAIAASTAAAFAARGASAQAAFPTKPVRIVVPYSPGGVSDITARLISEPLTTAWGQPVPVENKPGADGIIGTDAVAKAAPDGHTLGLVSSAHSVNAGLYRLPFDTLGDFSFVSMTSTTPLVLCASPAFAPNTLAELVAAAKAKPNEISYAGTGGLVRLAAALFANRTGTQFTYVPYRGSTQAHPDLMANRVNIMFDTVPAALPHIKSGALKAIATTGAKRSAQLPDVATIGEGFLPGFEASTWGIVIAPGGLPAPVLAKLNTDVVAALRQPTIVERHKSLGAEVLTSSPEETRKFVQAEAEKWTAAARAAGIDPQTVK